MGAVWIPMRPMHNPSFFIPFVLPWKLNGISLSEGTYSRCDINIVRNQKRLTGTKGNNEFLMPAAIIVVRKQFCDNAFPGDLQIALTIWESISNRCIRTTLALRESRVLESVWYWYVRIAEIRITGNYCHRKKYEFLHVVTSNSWVKPPREAKANTPAGCTCWMYLPAASAHVTFFRGEPTRKLLNTVVNQCGLLQTTAHWVDRTVFLTPCALRLA